MTNNTSIKVCLEDEVTYANHLLELLIAERDALSKSDGDALEAIAKQKSQVAEQLETSTERRNKHVFEETGQEVTNLQDYIDTSVSADNQPALKLLWEQLLEQLKQCREQNLLNGSVLDSSQRSIKQAIALLQGQGQAGELYGRAGKKLSSDSTHSLTHA